LVSRRRFRSSHALAVTNSARILSRSCSSTKVSCRVAPGTDPVTIPRSPTCKPWRLLQRFHSSTSTISLRPRRAVLFCLVDFMRTPPRHWHRRCLIAVLFESRAFADEGLWLFNNPPTKQLEEKYHFTPTAAWLE